MISHARMIEAKDTDWVCRLLRYAYHCVEQPVLDLYSAAHDAVTLTGTLV